MDEPGQGPLEGRDLLVEVRRILVEQPDRHDQGSWIGNYYLTPDEVADGCYRGVLLEAARPYALRPIGVQPEEPNSPWPVCGTTGCVAGWAAVLSVPAGSLIRGSQIELPGGEVTYVDRWAASKMGLTPSQAAHIFSPNRTDRARLIRILDALIEDPSIDPLLVD